MKSKILSRIRNVNSAVDSFIDFFSDVEKNEIFFIKMKLGRRNERSQIFSHEKNNFCHFFYFTLSFFLRMISQMDWTLALNEFHGLAHHGLVLRVSFFINNLVIQFSQCIFPHLQKSPPYSKTSNKENAEVFLRERKRERKKSQAIAFCEQKMCVRVCISVILRVSGCASVPVQT